MSTFTMDRGRMHVRLGGSRDSAAGLYVSIPEDNNGPAVSDVLVSATMIRLLARVISEANKQEKRSDVVSTLHDMARAYRQANLSATTQGTSEMGEGQ